MRIVTVLLKVRTAAAAAVRVAANRRCGVAAIPFAHIMIPLPMLAHALALAAVHAEVKVVLHGMPSWDEHAFHSHLLRRMHRFHGMPRMPGRPRNPRQLALTCALSLVCALPCLALVGLKPRSL